MKSLLSAAPEWLRRLVDSFPVRHPEIPQFPIRELRQSLSLIVPIPPTPDSTPEPGNKTLGRSSRSTRGGHVVGPQVESDAHVDLLQIASGHICGAGSSFTNDTFSGFA